LRRLTFQWWGRRSMDDLSDVNRRFVELRIDDDGVFETHEDDQCKQWRT
jgi:hypothetical protein